jgi:hypothetical protein
MTEAQESQVSRFNCPKCGSTDIRRSRNEGFWAAFFQVFGRWPFRCRSCRARFFRQSAPPPDA